MTEKDVNSTISSPTFDAPAFQYITVFQTVLMTRSPLSIGANETDPVSDQPVLRDSKGIPFIPGTSIAGVLRSYLETWFLAKYGAVEKPTPVDRLFGSTEKNCGQSMLIFDDLYPMGPVRTNVRDMVRISPGTGRTEVHGKFDREVLLPGELFPIRFELRTIQKISELETEVRKTLAALFDLFNGKNGKCQFSLGSRTSRGLGRIGMAPGFAGWNVEEYFIADPGGLKKWILHGANQINKSSKITGCDQLIGEWLKIQNMYRMDVKGLHLELKLKIRDGLIVRGPGRKGYTDDNKPSDSAQFREQLQDGSDYLLIPGTSVTGVIRHRARMIANTVYRSEGADYSEQLISMIFGTGPLCAKPRAGCFKIDEAIIDNPVELRHTRVAIDPWTGGALDHCLFTEDVIYDGTIRLNLSLSVKEKSKEHDFPAMAGLLMLVLRDLWEGDLPVGGEASVGRGVLEGMEGILVAEDKEENLVFKNGMLVSGGSMIPGWVDTFVNWQPIREGDTK